MGMYDTIHVPCPKCGEKADFQTKGGDCVLDYWDLEKAPAAAMSDVNRHSPAECFKCGTWFEVDYGLTMRVDYAKPVEVQPPCWCRFWETRKRCPEHGTTQNPNSAKEKP